MNFIFISQLRHYVGNLDAWNLNEKETVWLTLKIVFQLKKIKKIFLIEDNLLENKLIFFYFQINFKKKAEQIQQKAEEIFNRFKVTSK